MIEVEVKTDNDTLYALATYCQDKKGWLCSVADQDHQILDVNFYQASSAECEGFSWINSMVGAYLNKKNKTRH